MRGTEAGGETGIKVFVTLTLHTGPNPLNQSNSTKPFTLPHPSLLLFWHQTLLRLQAQDARLLD